MGPRHEKSSQVSLDPMRGRAGENRGLCKAPNSILMMSLTQPVHFLVIKSLLVMPLASTLSPTFLSSQGIYSQMFTGPTPSPVSLLHVGEKETFAETLKSPGIFVFRKNRALTGCQALCLQAFYSSH